jgi:hypothetical protein
LTGLSGGYLGRIDHDDVVVIAKIAVDRDIGRACPYRLVVKNPKLVVHQGPTVIVPDLDTDLFEHGELTMIVFFVRLDTVLVVRDLFHFYTTFVRGNEGLGHRREIELEGSDANRALSTVNVGDQLFRDRARQIAGVIHVLRISKVNVPSITATANDFSGWLCLLTEQS